MPSTHERAGQGTRCNAARRAAETYGDLIGMGIRDPTKVTRSALQYAASIASLILTTDAMIAELPMEREKQQTPGEMAI